MERAGVVATGRIASVAKHHTIDFSMSDIFGIVTEIVLENSEINLVFLSRHNTDGSRVSLSALWSSSTASLVDNLTENWLHVEPRHSYNRRLQYKHGVFSHAFEGAQVAVTIFGVAD